MSKSIQQWKAIELLYSSTGRLKKAEDCSSAVYKARIKDHDLRKAEALVLSEDVDPIQALRTFINRGRTQKAKDIIAKLDPLHDLELMHEIKIEKSRLAVVEGEWAEAFLISSQAIASGAKGHNLLTLLQIRSVAAYEIQDFTCALNDLQAMEALYSLYPSGSIPFYGKALRVKILARTKSLATAQSLLDSLWTDYCVTQKPTPNILAVLFRIEADLCRLSGKESHLFSGAAALCSNVEGDEVYKALSILEFVYGQERLEENFEFVKRDAENFLRIKKLVIELESKTDSVTSSASSLANMIKANSQLKVNDLYNLTSIVFLRRNIVINLKRWNVQAIDRDQVSNALSILSQGPMQKEEFFSRMWGVGKFVPRLHDNLIRTLLSRLRLYTELNITSEDKTISLKEVLYL